MDPAFLAADPAGALFEVDRFGLVAAHLLGGDDEVEFGAKVAPGDAEQFVVDVGDDPDLVAFAERSIAAFASRNGQPVGDAVGRNWRRRARSPSPCSPATLTIVRRRTSERRVRRSLTPAGPQRAAHERPPALSSTRSLGPLCRPR